jgi:putative transposase
MQVATKKIRVYLSEPRKVDRQIDYSRRAYNLCVACYRKWVKGDPPVDFTQLRRTIREVVKAEANGDAIGTTHLDEACAEVKRANQAVIRKRVKGQKSELAFRKKSATKQGFIYQRLPSTGLLKVLGEAYLTESIPPEAIKHSARLTREYGRYFLITKRFIPTAAAEIQGNAVGVDPGVRTFATTFATDVVTKLGEDFQKEKLRPLGIKLDQLYSKRKKRKIGSKVVRGMMDLCHYKFRLMLTWMAKKYGKTLIEVNEAYTSKTQSWNGKISKAGLTISDGSLIVDRDINGARGIFLRAVTR